MAQSKDNKYLHGSTCERHGVQAELCQNFTKVNMKIVLICALVVLLVLQGGFTSEVQAQNVMGTYLVGAQVDPPSGSAGFRLTVDYIWMRNIVGAPPVISCAFMRPDGTWVPIGVIDPSADMAGIVLTEDVFLRTQSFLDFNVALPDGTIQPGGYKVRCTSGQMFAVETAFSVVLDETAKPTPESGPEVTEAPVSEVAVTEAPLRVYNLQVEMVRDSSDGVVNAKWDGNLTVNPDGSVRSKVQGSLASDGPIRGNGKLLGNASVTITFTVDVAGTAEITPAGITMRLMQTFADFKVLKPAVTFIEQNPQEAIDAWQDYYQKLTEEATPQLLDQILRGLEFENVALPATQDVSVGIWKGTAVLSSQK
jgi:hypothetical protein